MNRNILGLVLFLGVGIWAYFKLQVNSKADGGKSAPVIEAELRNGSAYSMADSKGKYIIVDFWASWCPPCRVEIPHLISLQERNTEQKYEIVSIALEKDAATAEMAAERLGINWPTQIVQNAKFVATNKWARKYGVRDIPASFLVDPDGGLIGKMDAQSITAYLEEQGVL